MVMQPAVIMVSSLPRQISSITSPRQPTPSTSSSRGTFPAATSPRPDGQAHPNRFGRAAAEQLVQAQVAPGRLALLLGGTLDAEGGVLVGHHVVLVFRVDGLVLRWHVDFLRQQGRARKLLEEVGEARLREVQVCAG